MIMWAATGRRYGKCPLIVQPAGQCSPEPGYLVFPVSGLGGGVYGPVIVDGIWYNRPSGGCCSTWCEVALEGPTTAADITEITVAGEVVDPAAYVVYDGNLLVRTDGQCWPCCINYGQADPPGFVVEYEIGLPIPPAVQGAFERLACEMAKACVGGPCALPQRMTRLTRQGIDIEIEQVPVDERGMTLTGIKDVDDVILAVNPYRLTQAPQVLTPDLPLPRRLT